MVVGNQLVMTFSGMIFGKINKKSEKVGLAFSSQSSAVAQCLRGRGASSTGPLCAVQLQPAALRLICCDANAAFQQALFGTV